VLRVTLSNLRANKRRFISTFLAVMLGVAFLSGTLVLSASIQKTFDDLFANVNAGTDAYVRSATDITAGFQESRGRIDASLLDTIEGVDGVKTAEPNIQGFGQIIGADGKAIGNPDRGAPTFAGNWNEVPELNPFHLVDGKPPAAAREVVIDKASADDGDLKVGSPAKVLLQSGPTDVTVVGIAKFGSTDSPGGASFALFTLADAESLIASPGKVDSISVVAESGVSEETLRTRIAAEMPDGVEVLTGAEITAENQDDIHQALSIFTALFSGFSYVALIVAAFTIYNTFSILVAQRTKEMALLRAVGARRSQVLRSVFLEALAIGVTAALLGAVLGIVMSQLLKVVLSAFGFGLPSGSLSIPPSALITAVFVGVLVTVLAALIPARKASKVPPVAAMRDVQLERTRASVVRIVLGAIVLALGVQGILSVAFGHGANAGLRLLSAALLTTIGTIVLGPLVARPVALALGLPIRRLRGVTGALARQNASRNPRRTSGTASALLIGVALVSGVTLLAASGKASINHQVDRSFGGDLTVNSNSFGFGGLSPQLAQDLNSLPEVKAATGIRYGIAEIEGNGHTLFVIDRKTLPQVLDLGVKEGSIEDLGPQDLAVTQQVAKERGWEVGTKLPVLFADGSKSEFTVTTIFTNKDVANTDYAISTDAWNPHAEENYDSLVIVKLAEGVSLEQGRAAVAPLAAQYPNAKLQDREQFKAAQAKSINQFLAFVYAMLLLAIVISLMGIANTLALSIRERTRELGLLRAVGMDRAQVRSLVRWESVIIAVFGTVGGLGLGIVFSWAGVQALKDQGFTNYSVAPLSLLILLIAGAAAGVLAGILPARRAAKLDVLQAIASE
jgi:putative ABC transport system permease protein